MAVVAAAFTPAFKFKQRIFLVFDRGRKASAYGHSATLVRQVNCCPFKGGQGGLVKMRSHDTSLTSIEEFARMSGV
jgi:hypothetical protein